MLRKLIVVSLVLALCVFALIACGGTADTETQAPETEHVHEIEIEEVVATCQVRGYKKEVCKTCGEVISENASPKTACTPVAAATCTADSVCSVCNDVIEAAKGHTFGDAQVTAATCAAEGKSVVTCSTCGAVEETVIAKIAHNIPDANVTASTESTACGVPATKTGLCTLCNQTVTAELGSLPHTFVLEQVDIASDGTITIPCDACGEAVVISKETRFRLDFDAASIEEEVAALGLDTVNVVNQNATAVYKTVGDRSVLGFGVWNGAVWIEVDYTFLNDAAYYMISFDYAANKATSTGGQVAVFGSMPGTKNGTGTKEFANIAKYDRTTGWLKHGITNETEQYMQLEAGTFYHFDIIVNNTDGIAHLYVDGVYICSSKHYGINETAATMYEGKLGFRINEHGNTHDPVFDSFSISIVK